MDMDAICVASLTIPHPPPCRLPLTAACRPRATAVVVTSLRSREDGNADGDEDVEAFVSSLKSSGLFGDNDGAGAAGLGDGGAKGLAAAASDAAADLEEPGKLVREAAKPFREEMDRIEADFQRSISEKEEEMERKLEEFMKKIDETK